MLIWLFLLNLLEVSVVDMLNGLIIEFGLKVLVRVWLCMKVGVKLVWLFGL